MIDKYHQLMAALSTEAPMLSMALQHHRNMRGAPMSYGTMPYLAPLMEEFPKLEGADIISGVQTGKSELFIVLMLYLAGELGRVCAYVLPTFAVRGRFVKRRIDPLLVDVPHYQERCPGGAPGLAPITGAKGSQSLKLFGSGTLMFLGSNTTTEFVEFSADALFIDEVDQCDPDNLTKARDRIQASPHPQLFRLGNPTLPGVGVDKLYQRSDQRRWYYKCPHCNEAQPLDWFVNFVRKESDGRWMPKDRERSGHAQLTTGGRLKVQTNDLRPVCRRCDEPFERAEAWFAWVAENPGNALRKGFRMTRLDVLHQSIRELYAAWVECQGSTSAMATFMTSNLGFAYEQAGQQVTVEDLAAAATGAENDHVGGPEYEDELVVMGVDVGSVLNVNIDCVRMREVQVAEGEDLAEAMQDAVVRVGVHVGAYINFEDLDDLIERFHVDVVVIDAMPETRKAQELRDRWLGDVEVWLCRFYSVPKVGRQRFGISLDWKTKVVSVDRTQVLDAAYDDIRNGARVFPEDCFTVFGWSDQMRAPKRVLDLAKQRIVWTEGSAADHYRLSDVYSLVAYQLSQSGGTYSAG